MTPTTYTVPTVNLTGSTYNLNKTSNASNWNHSGGTLAGSGNVTVASGQDLRVDGRDDVRRRDDDDRLGRDADDQRGRRRRRSVTITNNGTITWVAGQLQMSNGTINNNATFTAQPDNTSATSAAPTPSTTTPPAPSTANRAPARPDRRHPLQQRRHGQRPVGTLGFTGVFTQTAGFTILNGGDIGTSSGLNIQGGTLKGKGTITGNVFNGGTVAPGLSPGS